MGVSVALRAKYLLPWCCIHDSLKFDMQSDHVLKKSNFDVLTPLPKSTQGVGHRSSIKNHFDMFLIYCNAVCMQNFCKKYLHLTELLRNLQIRPLTPLGGWYIFNHGFAYLQALGNHGL